MFDYPRDNKTKPRPLINTNDYSTYLTNVLAN